jgi:tripartite-type tricarboxylate transporter receptor subunit TctC
MTFRCLVTAALSAAVFTLEHSAWGQAYPVRPVRLVAPFLAGGTTDVNARTLIEQLKRQFGQSIVVDNRAGANGIIGTEIVARAAPDGYTLLYVSSSMALNPSIYRKLPYDPVKDFVPVTQVAAMVGFLLIVNPSLPANSVRELIVMAQAKDSKIAFGSFGYGNASHLAAEVFKLHTGTQMLHVPYKGTAVARNGLLGGEVQLLFGPPTVFVEHVKAGKLRALGFSGTSRWAMMPEVPTLAETVPGLYITAGWDSVFAPARVSGDIISRLWTEIHKALQVPKVREFLVSGGYEPVGSAPQEFRQFFQSEMKRYAQIVRDAKIQAE